LIKTIRFLTVALVLAISASAVAQQTAPSANLPNEATIMGFLQQMFGYDSAITYKVSSMKPAEAPGFTDVTVILTNPQGDQALNFFVSPDGKFALVGQLLDFGADPFSRYRSLLTAADGPIRGPKDAKVNIVEFADLECPACKAALPNIEKMQSENPNVRVIFQNFPLEKLHPWALRAALYVDCLKTNSDVAWKFIDGVYSHQEEIKPETADAMLKQYATEAGADAKVAACIADPKTNANVEASIKLGDNLAVNSTPTIFVNGRKISSFNSLPYDTFKLLVDFAAKNPK
jgi:protein-disulfide isomerase